MCSPFPPFCETHITKEWLRESNRLKLTNTEIVEIENVIKEQPYTDIIKADNEDEMKYFISLGYKYFATVKNCDLK